MKYCCFVHLLEIVLLKCNFRQFAENELWPIAGKIDKSGEFPAEQVRKMGELGNKEIMHF